MKKKNRINILSTTTIIRLFITLIITSISNASLYAQETLIVGQVMDKADRKPLESVSVYFKGASFYTQTNEDGYFLIRNTGKESILVFSLIGYEKEQVRVRPGESGAVEILLQERLNILDELLVNPGENPANDFMKKVWANKRKNDIAASLKSNEQSLVLLSKQDSRWANNRLFEQFRTGNISINDTMLIVPLYMEEAQYLLEDKKKKQVSSNTFNTSESTVKIISGLLSGLDSEINFYRNSIPILGKNLISPLASIGMTYYRYYLLDSIQTSCGKEYLVRFRSKNTKNLAFNGEMRIDSATYALTSINAELPRQANLNFIHNLHLNQSFKSSEGLWIPYSKTSKWDMTYELLKDNNNKTAELLISRNADLTLENETLKIRTDSFANSDYSLQMLNDHIATVQESPLYKTANYIADALLTGYARAGIFDIGHIVDIARLTDTEGLRLALPIRTNEHLWKDIMLGGHLGYGFRNKELHYSATAQWKIPVSKNRTILGINYLNDYRRIDYDYNNFLWRENPLSTGDENFASTFLSFRSQNRLSLRKELSVFVYNDWSTDVESKWIYRDVQYFPNELLPLNSNGESFDVLKTQNISFTTRFSFGERTVEEHFQRLYLKSLKPVIYATLDAGRYEFGKNNGYYSKISGTVLHRGQFILGEWRYMIDAGKIFGSVPYPLLKAIQGKGNGHYNRFEFALMGNREYIADTYGTLFSELILNGVLFNNIPVVKHLNLREIASFKMAYGCLSTSHAQLMDIPTISTTFTQPYSEVSIGFCNLLGIMSIQSIWRLSDLDKPNIKRWGIKFNIMFTL